MSTLPAPHLPALYLDGRSGRGHAVQLSCANGHLQMQGPAISRVESIADVTLSPRLGRTRRRIEFPDGAVCELEDDALLDRWFTAASHQRWNLLARLEGHWGMIAASFVLVMALVGAVAVWGLPWAAQKVAARVPQEWVVQLGAGTLTGLEQLLGHTTALPVTRQQALQARFAELASGAGVASTLVLRDWPKLGPNALALPDGTIVMTDQLVALANDDRELLAVLAHELGHVHERHALQKLLASSGVAALVFVLTGDVSGLSSIVVAAPTVMTHLQHSRTLEADADRYAFALMSRQGLDPAWFARIIRKLEAAHGGQNVADKDRADKDKATDQDGSGDMSNWLLSHPASEERARRAEQYRAH